MKQLKPAIIALVSAVLLFFPTPKMNSFGFENYGGYYTANSLNWTGFDYENYNDNSGYGYGSGRFFLPNLVNREALVPFTYCPDWYFGGESDLNYGDDAHLYKKLHPEHYAVNVEEWSKIVPKASKEDIQKAMYEVNSDMFCSQLETNSFKGNTFIKAIEKEKDLWEYFLLAKECEHYFDGSGWANDNVKGNLLALPAKLEKMLKTTKNTFVRQRAAYQLIKAYEYTDQQAKELLIFDEYFKRDAAIQKSWVYGHACYHYARANDSSLDVKRLYLARTFRLAPDKRMVAMLKMPSLDDDDTEVARYKVELKSRETTDADRLTWTVMNTLRYPGRSLADIQKVYRAEPTNRELSLLVEREINKLEDWLFSYKPDAYNFSRSHLNTEGNLLSYSAREGNNSETDEAKAKVAQKSLTNYKSDLAYLQQVSTFIEQIAQEGKSVDKTFMNLAAAHLAFLRKDVAKTRQYVATVRQDTKIANNVRAQADMIEILVGIYAGTAFDKDLENSIMALDKTMARDTGTVMAGKKWMAQIYNFLGNKFVDAGRKAEGCLLLMKSNPAYLKLFDMGKPADFDAVLKIMEKPQTPFEKFLSQVKVPYTGGWVYDEASKTWGPQKRAAEWDVSKIRDYKATYYLRQDQWDSARLALAAIPKTYWKQEPYKSMLNCNAFFVDIQRPHAPVDADKTRFDKLAFVEKVIQLKNEFAANPSANARNAYLIGNAYYNCSWYGNFWLMLDVSWSSGYGASDMNGDNPIAFKGMFFQHSKAIEWYEKAATNATDPSLKALSTFMMSWCENQAIGYWESYRNQEKDKSGKPVDHNWLSQLSGPMSKTEYWCQQYDNLAHKYSGY